MRGAWFIGLSGRKSSWGNSEGRAGARSSGLPQEALLRTVKRVLLLLSVCCMSTSPVMGTAPTINGVLESLYGLPKVWQTVQTGFGNSTPSAGSQAAGGSELVAGYGLIAGDRINLFFSGNLQNNGNRLIVFVDSAPGGQNRLRGDNTGTMLQRLGDSGGPNGLTFDSGFEPDHALILNCNATTLFVDYQRLNTDAGSTSVYLGANNLGTANLLSGGINLIGVQASLNNGNNQGVDAGTASGQVPTLPTLGLELGLPTSTFGSGPVRVMAVIVNDTGSTLSNQFLPDVGANGATVGNFGEPRGINLNASPGRQFFFVERPWNGRVSVARRTSATGLQGLRIEDYLGDVEGQTTPIRIRSFNPSTGFNRATIEGQATTQGSLRRSLDGRFLTFGAFDGAQGTSVTASTPRVIGRVDASGRRTTSTYLNVAQTLRSAVSTDGVEVWGATDDSIRFANFGSTAASVTSATSRTLGLFNLRLHQITASGINRFAALPTSTNTASGLTLSGLTGSPDFGDAIQAGPQVLYIADARSAAAGGGVHRLNWNGTAFALAYTFNVGTGAKGLAISNVDGVNVLYVTTNVGLLRIRDTGAASAVTTLLAASNELTGVDLSPIQVERVAPVANEDTISVEEDQSVTVPNSTILGNDTDDNLPEPLFIQSISAPAGVTVQLNRAAGTVTFTPAPNVSGNRILTVVITDDELTATSTLNLNITPINDDPVLGAVGNRSVNEGVPLTFTLTSTDPDGGAPVYGIVNAPPGASVNPTTGQFSWTPSENQDGTYSVTLTVSDGTGGSDSETIEIVVNEVNQAPSLQPVPNQSVAEESLLSFSAMGADEDLVNGAPQPLTYSLIGAPSGMNIVPSTGAVSWTPTEAQGPNTYSFQVQVSDGTLTASRPVQVTVTEVNRAPDWAAVPTQQVNEGTTLTLDLATFVSDPDIPANTPLSFSLQSGPQGLTVSNEGVLTWTPTEAQGPSSVSAVVRVQDSGDPAASSTQTVSIQVQEVNEPPVFATVPLQTAIEGVEFTLNLAPLGSDPDLPVQSLTFERLSGPSGLTITSAGAVRWTPSETDGGTTVSFSVVLRDSFVPAASVTQTIEIQVAEANVAPVLNVFDTIHSIPERALWTLDTGATDSDVPAQTLTYSLVGAPEGMNVNASSGQISWTPTEAQGPGSFNFSLRVVDGAGGEDIRALSVTVTEVNQAPVVPAIPERQHPEGTLLQFGIGASDPDGPAPTVLTYELVGPAHGATLGSTTGIFSWTPTEAQGPGSFDFTVRVTDNGNPGLSTTQTFRINVTEVNVTPTAIAQSLNAEIGQPLAITLTGSDPDIPTQTLTFEVTSLPTHGTLSGNAPNLSYLPNPGYVGTDSFRFVVRDGQTVSQEATIEISVSGLMVTLEIQMNGLIAAPGTTVTRGLTILFGDLGGGPNPPVQLSRNVVFNDVGRATLTFGPADGLQLLPGVSTYGISVKDELHTLRRTMLLTPSASGYAATVNLVGGNLNRDGRIDIADYVVYATRFGAEVDPNTPLALLTNPNFRHADVSGDGRVDNADFSFIAAAFAQLDDAPITGSSRPATPRVRMTVADAIRESGSRNAQDLDLNRDEWITVDEINRYLATVGSGSP